jgi:RNA polymerase sigma-70 factor (ECF subfamily)
MSAPAEIAILAAEPAQGTSCPRREAFAGIVREHAASISRLASRVVADPADAEDLVQETFLRAWRGIRRFRGDAKVRTWLARILLNAARDQARRRRPARLTGETPAPGRDHGAHGAARRDLLARVLAAVHALPRRQRETLLLRARAGLSYEEIAEMLAIRPGVVKLHLVRARKKLRRKFGHEIEDAGGRP